MHGSLKFNHNWRPEQQRVLANVLAYLDDKRIHIVAAPGAGKTVIGIEIFNRLALKALVVSPTRLIRNQWLERLTDFLTTKDLPNWCSKDLHDSRYFTAVTYQGLFSLDKKISQEDEGAQFKSISQWFKQHEFKLLILDEAHHLKAAWWKVLMKFVETNPELIIISLTATPPYDASPGEWQKYQKLCGPVDEQISIPELVRSNSLCPHQDYIWMVKTDDKVITSLKKHQDNLEKFIQSLNNQNELIYLLQLHHFLDENREIRLQELYNNLDECFALLSLLKDKKQQLPQRMLEILGIGKEDVPPLSVFSWEMLLQSFIQGKYYPKAQVVESFRQTLETLLKSKRFIRNKHVSLDSTKKKLQAFNKTQERIKACFEISLVEYKNRKNWMRLVVLADFIRDEKFQLTLDGLQAPTGAYPIFHYFIHHLPENLQQQTVLLTGRLAIIPKEIISDLAEQLDLTKELNIQDYSEHKDYVLIDSQTEKLTQAVTQLHKIGTISIIIGTRSLLGEGWDAPHINALIMATQTGAFVTSNQLRGRAIRIDTNDELKTASIWHIIAVAQDASLNKSIFRDLNKRFKTFAGLHASELKIESGIARMALFEEINPDNELINQSNKIMESRLKNDIFNLQARWQNALEKVTEHRLQTGLQINFKGNKRNNISKYTGKISNHVSKKQKKNAKYAISAYISIPLFLKITGFAQMALYSSIAGLILLPSLAIMSYFKARNVIALRPQHYAKLFAHILFDSLHQLNLMQSKINRQQDNIIMSTVEGDYYRFSLANHTHKDNELFLTALSQLLEPIKRPKYLIALAKKPTIEDIYPLPSVFSLSKKQATVFLKNWQKYIPEFSHAYLLSSNSLEGKKIMIQLLAKLYNKKNNDEIRLVERWQ